MNRRLMVDCETLDLGERPVLLSIGAVVFDDNQIQDYFEYFIDKETAIREGFTVSQSTLDWWDQQNPDARAYAFNGEGDIQEALKALVQFYELNECSEIWSKGALADIRWINNALDHFGIDHPWKYTREFCFRTLLKSVPKFDLDFVGMPHNALDDAIHQAKQFIKIKRMQANTHEKNALLQKLSTLFKELESSKEDSYVYASGRVRGYLDSIFELPYFTQDEMDSYFDQLDKLNNKLESWFQSLQ